MLNVAVARSSCDDSEIRYLLRFCGWCPVFT